MEVLKTRETMLTNQEVLSFLNALKKEEDNKQQHERCKQLSTVIYEVYIFGFWNINLKNDIDNSRRKKKISFLQF